jgi:hypothetical protein
MTGSSGVSRRSITAMSLAGRSLPGWPLYVGQRARCPAASSGRFLFAGNRVCQRTDGGIVAGPHRLGLPAGPRACPRIFGGGGQDARADRICKGGKYPHMFCPAGGVRTSAAAGRRLSGGPGPGPGRQGAVRCSRTQLDLMGHDPKPASRADQAHSGTTDVTRTGRGIHTAGNGEAAGQWLFRWAGSAPCKTVGLAYVGSNPTPATQNPRSDPVPVFPDAGSDAWPGAVR